MLSATIKTTRVGQPISSTQHATSRACGETAYAPRAQTEMPPCPPQRGECSPPTGSSRTHGHRGLDLYTACKDNQLRVHLNSLMVAQLWRLDETQ